MTADGTYQGDIFNNAIVNDYSLWPPKITRLRTYVAKFRNYTSIIWGCRNY